MEIKEISEKVKKENEFIQEIFQEIGKVIVGQKYMIERLLMGFLTNGHVLLEGVPGLAKTMTVNCFAKVTDTNFKRIQFTPDLLPADLIGTEIFNPKSGEFTIKRGPVFSNLILADEINRSPAKVQSALLECMQEKQVSIGDETFKIDEPFLVLATQNPIEQEGTYPLPEAQVDRFMFKLKIGYPSKEEEKIILNRMSSSSGLKINLKSIVGPKDIVRLRNLIDDIYIDEKIKDYIVDIIHATRNPEEYGMEDLKNLISFGASPRATIYLSIASKAYAFLQGRGYVTPNDVKVIGMDVLRHRVIPSYEAEAEEKTSEDLVRIIFDNIQVP